ncbi:DEAD/DEAH box helicase family protein [Tenacibaculum amylolyticum]|uniref:DEAD/DEAH box helicase family protein n=1 Tax=Tenacibaculum amylolyticum TaxID=104269 RepID=UPI00389439BD
MSDAIKKLRFKYDWRPYQDKILTNFSAHIEDNHFHIVAPPGSGKTILGIEILRRIGKRTLVLAPTLTIRNQWKDRLTNFFTEDACFEDVSFSIQKPAAITFATYQGLHRFFKSFESKTTYFDFFKEHGIEVLLLDEAHHLKNAWWKCLYDLKETHLQTVIALTATPPYDSDRSEIQKYFKLCGEIDDEIVVPDLVKEQNLCPHQDFIYLSTPEDDEIKLITDFKRKVNGFINSIQKDSEFSSFLQEHRFYKTTEIHLEEIYKYSDFFSAMLIFLHRTGILIPKEKLYILGFNEDEHIEFPSLSNEWVEILFQFLLVTDRETLLTHEPYLSTIEKRLRKLAIFSKNKVDLTGNEILYKSLNNSPSKLKSITKIVRQEQKNLAENLRCVILTDYIRKEYLATASDAYEDIQKIGVIPIFYHLKNQIFYPKSLAVLSGSIVLIHHTILEYVAEIDTIENYQISYLKSDHNFVTIASKSSSQKNIVEIITELFEKGHIKVLIGTKSLLGEGWDAPSINSLILASTVGSFVTSNQMRGRAMRIHQNNLKKVGIIWHLACIDPTDKYGGKDLKILKRRFSSFLGITNTEDIGIESGMSRLDLPATIFPKDVETLNIRTFHQSENRAFIAEKWEKSIFKGKRMQDELVYLTSLKERSFNKRATYVKAITYGFTSVFFIILFILASFILLYFAKQQKVTLFLYTGLAFLFIWVLFRFYQSFKTHLRFSLVDNTVHYTALTILRSLYELELFTTPYNKVKIKTKLTSISEVTCSIEGVTKLESTIFMSALNSTLQPIESPRYLLLDRSWIHRKLKIDRFISVPEIFSSHKEKALVFQKHWNRYFHTSELIYTRTVSGRKKLLKARLQHIKNANKKTVKKKEVWR